MFNDFAGRYGEQEQRGIVIWQEADGDAVDNKARKVLDNELDIEHVTLQVEKQDCRGARRSWSALEFSPSARQERNLVLDKKVQKDTVVGVPLFEAHWRCCAKDNLSSAFQVERITEPIDLQTMSLILLDFTAKGSDVAIQKLMLMSLRTPWICRSTLPPAKKAKLQKRSSRQR